MVAALFDSNILIDYLRGVDAAREEISRYDDKSISIITWMEVMAGAPQEATVPTKAFLEGFRLVHLDDEIAARAVEMRRVHKIKLPDAIIWATAESEKLLLVTRNIKDFPVDTPGVRMPYRLS